EPEVADPQQIDPEPAAERVAGPGAERRRQQQERQSPAGAPPDQHVQPGVEDPDEDREDRRRTEHGEPPRAADRAPYAATAMRPPPRTTSPSSKTHACP